MSNKRK